MRLLNRSPVVPVLRFNGPIGVASSSFAKGLSLATAAGPIEKAFAMSKLPTVAIVINSPGGSPVQSNLIFRRVRQLAKEKNKRVYVFAEDVCASGGYFLALAGDEIYADPSSIIGSIGVISAGFGLQKTIEKIGAERRVYTSGENKSILDPFKPERPEDIQRLKSILGNIHEVFINAVKERRGSKLNDMAGDMFTGAFWTASRAAEMGLIDGIADMREKMRDMHGEKVRLRAVPFGGGGLLGKLKRMPGMSGTGPATGAGLAGLLDGAGGTLTDDVLAALEARAMWSRFGL